MNRIASRIRWLYALTWTVLLLLLLLTPGVLTPQTLLGDLTDKAGHAAMFGVLTVVWFWLLLCYRTWQRALLIAFWLGLFAGGSTEFAQRFVPGRESIIWDFVANTFGVSSAALGLYGWLRRRTVRGSSASV
ncbi:MAG: VanZ family protein [Anaerolineae bacterium]|nr:VanZ family protein [Anaerolineae bacterium]